jgi:hypothetical protein
VALAYACGPTSGAKAAPSCADLQSQLNACTNISQSTKDKFAGFCATAADACRSCLDGNLCGVTEQCDPACGKTSDGGTVPDAGSPADTGSSDSGSDVVVAVDGGPLLVLGGTFKALTLNAVDGIGVISTSVPPEFADAGIRSEFKAFISDKSNLCGTGVVRQNETIFAITAVSGSATFQAGTYTEMLQEVPGQVDVSITKLNAACTSNSQDYGSASGTVVITSVTASAVAGTFDVTLLGDAGTLQGSFNVPLCPSLSTSCVP